MIQPHGGKLVDRVLKGKDRAQALDRAPGLPRLTIDPELVSDIENIATGVYSPLEGFLGAIFVRQFSSDSVSATKWQRKSGHYSNAVPAGTG